MSNGEMKSDWFTKINPNGRIPAIGMNLWTHVLVSVIALSAFCHGVSCVPCAHACCIACCARVRTADDLGLTRDIVPTAEYNFVSGHASCRYNLVAVPVLCSGPRQLGLPRV